MPEGAVPRALEYVGLLLLLCLASTFACWAAANVARAEYRRLPSAWRAFRVRGTRLAVVVAVAWTACAAGVAVAAPASPDFRHTMTNLPRYLTSA